MNELQRVRRNYDLFCAIAKGQSFRTVAYQYSITHTRVQQIFNNVKAKIETDQGSLPSRFGLTGAPAVRIDVDNWLLAARQSFKKRTGVKLKT